MIPYPRVNCLKTIPFTAAYTHIAHIWQYSPRGFFSRATRSFVGRHVFGQRPKTRAAKPRVLLLVNLSLLLGLGHGCCRFELLYGNVLGTLFHFIGYYDVAKQTGYKFRPKKFPLRNTTQHHSVLMRNHEMKKVGRHK